MADPRYLNAVAPHTQVYRSAIQATLSDTVDETFSAAGILLGAAGTVKITQPGGIDVALPLAANVWHTMAVDRVWTTGTDSAVSTAGVWLGYP